LRKYLKRYGVETSSIVNILQLTKWRRWKGIWNPTKVKICASFIPFEQLRMVANLPYFNSNIYYRKSSFGGGGE
jgi:hypothetical protein